MLCTTAGYRDPIVPWVNYYYVHKVSRDPTSAKSPEMWDLEHSSLFARKRY